MNPREDRAALNAIANFAIAGELISLTPYGNGHINTTLLAIFNEGCEKKYILQKINKTVFKRPYDLMENISKVTANLMEQVAKRGGNPEREVLNLVPTKGGDMWYVSEDGEYWRVYLFVVDTISCETPDTPELFRNSGRAFGEFQLLLADYPASTLHETIIDFHSTPVRICQFEEALEIDCKNRAKDIASEIEFVRSHIAEASILFDMQKNGDLPLRVTHNDTKLNNVLLDKTSGKPVCVIDLDTVMPGLSVNDFGDAIRFGANTAFEDEKDLSKCTLSLEMFEAYAEGYLEYANLTDNEIKMLPMGAKMMTFECGVRFLADYLSGDVYFRTHRPEHNLDRARTQFKLVSDMEQKWDKMHAIINRIAAGNK